MNKIYDADCDKRRVSGCKSYCCRLLVRITTDEMRPTKDRSTPKGFINKDIEGHCIHFDNNNFYCAIWKNRSAIFRAYACKHLFLLQATINRPFNNLVDLIKLANIFELPENRHIKAPYTKNS